MVTRADAERERTEAAADIQADGARVTLLYDGGRVDAATGSKTSARQSVKLWALLGSYAANLVDGQRVQQGDIRMLVADKALGGFSVAPLPSVFDSSVSTGFWLYLPADPEKWPEATDPPALGDRRLVVGALSGTVSVGGYPVLRVLQCRG